MHKGDLVRFNTGHEKIKRQLDRGKDYFNASRPSTCEEREEWRQQMHRDIEEAHKTGVNTRDIALDDAGESRLPPRTIGVPLSIDGIFIIERARCRAQLSWGNKTSGLAKIIDPESGSIAFVKREMLEVLK
tara:strand:- start:21834 stop:22226 length:393 start_codon:yes stop_codon:yes gene_type:complete